MSDKKIKCVIWDLDNTIWDGTLLEKDSVKIKPEVVKIIEQLDKRGILNSIASKNDYGQAMKKLKEFRLDFYFLYPEIHMGAKSESVKAIIKNLNISPDSVAFVDDQQYELEEVKYHNPEVLCIPAEDMNTILDKDEFMPKFVTDESSKRRELYAADIKRKEYELEIKLPQNKFLESLNMQMRFYNACEDDLKRVEELTIRTHQLNSTGVTFDYNQLAYFIASDSHSLIISELKDKFGDYGKIGITLIEKGKDTWNIKLHLMSCRVMSRGVGNIVLNHIIHSAKDRKIQLLADFNKTNVNKFMYLTYKMLGFKEIYQENDFVRFEFDSSSKMEYPNYVTVDNSKCMI